MSISNSLANALSGLTASSKMAEIVSSNLANVMTDGYGRRVVNLSAQTVGGRGAGVQIDSMTRMVNRGVLADRRIADANLAGLGLSFQSLGRLENAVGKIGDGSSLSAKLAAFENALISASSDPSSDVRLGFALDRLKDVSRSLNQGADEIQTLRQDADAAIAANVDALNNALKQVEVLNSDITYSRNSGQDPSALMDQRQKVIDGIAELVPIRELDRPGGQVALMTVSGQMLIDGPAQVVSFTPAHTITPDMTFESGALSGLKVNGVPASLDNGVGKMAGGLIGAAFELRDKTLVSAQSNLDAVAQDILFRFQDSGVDPTVGASDKGLLTDAGDRFDLANSVGLSARIAVSSLVDPDQGGALFRMRDGASATIAGQSGDSAQINRWLSALSEPRQLSGGGNAGTAAGHLAGFMSFVSSSLASTDQEQSFATARWDTLRQAELADGVDTDQELQTLMRVEQAYAANAKVIQTIDGLMQRLMEL